MSIVREKPLDSKQSTIDELTRLKTLTTDSQVLIYLEREVSRQELDLENRRKIEEMAEKIELRKEGDKNFKEAPKIVKKTGFKRKAMTSYSWDQSDKKLKFYLKNAEGVKKEDEVKVVFDGGNKMSFMLTAEEKKLEYFYDIPILFAHLDVDAKQLIKVKDSYVFISLSKKESKKWEHLTNQDKSAAVEKADKMSKLGAASGGAGDNADPQKSIMNMMKNMYEDGDDEMKRTINKAWEQSQNKRGEGGMPGMPGMPDMGGLGGMM